MDMHSEVVIDAPASAAGQVLGAQFGDIAAWSNLDVSFLEGDLGVGCARVCEGPAFGPFPASRTKEVLTEFDPDAMVFAYDAGCAPRAGLPRR